MVKSQKNSIESVPNNNKTSLPIKNILLLGVFFQLGEFCVWEIGGPHFLFKGILKIYKMGIF